MDFESLVSKVERLKESPRVDGLLLLGSTGQSTLNAFSDRDLLIVLDECDPSITNGAVFCDDVLVDLVFATRQQVDLSVRPGPDHSRTRLDLSVQGKLDSLAKSLCRSN